MAHGTGLVADQTASGLCGRRSSVSSEDVREGCSCSVGFGPEDNASACDVGKIGTPKGIITSHAA